MLTVAQMVENSLNLTTFDQDLTVLLTSNIEMAETSRPDTPRAEPGQELEKVETPGARSIEALVDMLGVTPAQTLKTLIVEGDEQPIALALRGDHELNAVKTQKIVGVA